MECRGDRAELGVGSRVAGEAEDHPYVGDVAERPQHTELAPAQLLGEVHDRVRELWGDALPGGELGVLEQVALVVPVGPQSARRELTDAGCLATAR